MNFDNQHKKYSATKLVQLQVFICSENGKTKFDMLVWVVMNMDENRYISAHNDKRNWPFHIRSCCQIENLRALKSYGQIESVKGPKILQI